MNTNSERLSAVNYHDRSKITGDRTYRILEARARRARVRKFIHVCEQIGGAILVMITIALALALGWNFRI